MAADPIRLTRPCQSAVSTPEGSTSASVFMFLLIEVFSSTAVFLRAVRGFCMFGSVSVKADAVLHTLEYRNTLMALNLPL